MKKFVCSICGYVYEGETAPEKCPQCNAPASKFNEVKEDGGLQFACEHIVGIAKDVEDKDIIEGLNQNFMGECTEVGMYLAMSRVADREGYPEVAELLGDVVTDSTKKNLEMRVMAEHGATQGKLDLATKAKQQGLDAIHDTVHEMAKDEARHGKAFQGLLNRYFK